MSTENARFGWARYLTMDVVIGVVLGVVLAVLLIALGRPSWGVGVWSVGLLLSIIAPILSVAFRLIAPRRLDAPSVARPT